MKNTNTLPCVRPISYIELDRPDLAGSNYVIDRDGETRPIALSTLTPDADDVIFTAVYTPSGDSIHVVYTPEFDVYRMLLR
jgi:hypothetical protein